MANLSAALQSQREERDHLAGRLREADAVLAQYREREEQEKTFAAEEQKLCRDPDFSMFCTNVGTEELVLVVTVPLGLGGEGVDVGTRDVNEGGPK